MRHSNLPLGRPPLNPPASGGIKGGAMRCGYKPSLPWGASVYLFFKFTIVCLKALKHIINYIFNLSHCPLKLHRSFRRDGVFPPAKHSTFAHSTALRQVHSGFPGFTQPNPPNLRFRQNISRLVYQTFAQGSSEL